MTDKQESVVRQGRKPQINLEVTEEEKVFFGQLAEARGMKLAALVRELLDNEGKRLGIPISLDDYLSDFPNYQYFVSADRDSEIKLAVFRQFLQKFKSDCDFSISGYEANSYSTSVQCTAYSSSGENSNTIFLGISSETVKNYDERKKIDEAWRNVLGLSLNLDDKWNGECYWVDKMRTLKGKQILLKQFVEKHCGATLDVNASYSWGSVFKVFAPIENDKNVLQIEYLPTRTGEAAELMKALEEYQRLVSQQ